MKIQIENFGPIKDFLFDSDKDMHMIYGKNGTGKSYAAYCIYLILKKFKDFSLYDSLEQLDTIELKGINDNLVDKLKNKEGEQIEILEDIQKLIKVVLQETVLKGIQRAFLNTYSGISNLRNQFSGEPFKITIILKSIELSFTEGKQGNITISDISIFNTYQAFLEKNSQGKDRITFSFFVNSKRRLSVSYPFDSLDFIWQDIAERLLTDITSDITDNINEIYFLPASRSGLYEALNSFSPIIAELSQQRFQIQNKIELPSLTEPISDYLISLSTLDSKLINSDLNKIALKIEKEVLGGETYYNEKTKKLFFHPVKTKLNLEMSQSSSMVAEISPIVAYLRHIIPQFSQSKRLDFHSRNRRLLRHRLNESQKSPDKKSHILFIEEPEAHLHPDIQVKLMELFAKLSKFKIKIVMTSHSNYMFSKLGNLLLSGKIDSKKVAAYHLVLGKQGSNVKKDMNATPDGIEDHNFVDTSVKLYNERMRLESKITNRKK